MRALRPTCIAIPAALRLAQAALAGALLVLLGTSSATDSADPGNRGVAEAVAFEHYSPLSTSGEIMRRLTSPLAQLKAAAEADKAARTLQGQLVDLAHEHFVLYVPKTKPPPGQGYALLIFVPPWPQARIPSEWIPALEQHHMIMASAEQSGNEASPLNRRVPLALLALENIRAKYSVDAGETFVGGFSGGSKIALRLLIGYPDQFRGALLNAGSDPVGTQDLPLPPQNLLLKVQESTRLVYVTGERDQVHLIDDMNSRTSLKRWCIFDVVTLNEPRREHEPADALAFAQALNALLRPESPRAELKSCQDKLKRRVDEDLDRVGALIKGGDRHALSALKSLDEKYGGLVSPLVQRR